MSKPTGTMLELLQVALDRATEIGDEEIAQSLKALIEGKASTTWSPWGDRRVLLSLEVNQRTTLNAEVEVVEETWSSDPRKPGRVRMRAIEGGTAYWVGPRSSEWGSIPCGYESVQDPRTAVYLPPGEDF